jgi:hypothetical protein
VTTIRERLSGERQSWPPSVRDSALAEAAELAAGLLDSATSTIDGSIRDTAALLKELRATMAELRALAAVTTGGRQDPVDKLEGAGPSNVVEFRDRGGPRKVTS